MPTDASTRGEDEGPAGNVLLANEGSFMLSSCPVGVWKMCRLGKVTVTDRAGATVRVRLWKHSGTWIGGINFDYVHVRHLGADRDEADARRWW